MKRIAIIPARGGSKRIKNKNIKNFCGKPIIYYPINELLKSKLFDKIHVSTDDSKIIQVVNKIGLEIDFKRPKNLSDDYTPIMPVIKFVINEYKKINQNFDEIWVILPCSPFINSSDLKIATIKFQQNKMLNPLMAVTEYPAPIDWAFEINEKNILKPLNQGAFATRSQDLKPKFYDAGMFYIYSINSILNMNLKGSDENFIPHILPKYSSIDIDSINDWEFAEKIFKLNKI